MKAASESLELQNQDTEIKVRAEHKAGEFISKIEKVKDKRTDKVCRNSASPSSKKEKLAEIGINKMQTHRLEQMASVAEKKFKELADAKIATADYHRAMSTSNDPLPNQFSLKRIFVASALVAGWAWAVRIDSFLAMFVSYLLSCSAIALTGIGKKSGPVFRGAISGALIPSILWSAMMVLAHEDFKAAELVDAVLFGCIALPVFGAFFGAFAGALVAAGSSSSGMRCPIE